MVRAFSTQLGLVLEQKRVSGKGSKITAIPDQRTLVCQGFVGQSVRQDCLREIAQKIRKNGGDYMLTIQRNQPTLLDEVS